LWPDVDPGSCLPCGDECTCDKNLPPERISITGPTQESVEKKWTNPVDGCKWLCMGAFDLTTETFKGTCRTKGDRGISQVSLSEIPILLTSTLPQILSSTQHTCSRIDN